MMPVRFGTRRAEKPVETTRFAASQICHVETNVIPMLCGVQFYSNTDGGLIKEM